MGKKLKKVPLLMEIHLDENLLAIRTRSHVNLTKAAFVIDRSLSGDDFIKGFHRIAGTTPFLTEAMEDLWQKSLYWLERNPGSEVTCIDADEQMIVITADQLPILKARSLN